jgi:hypothetical protein
MRRVKLILLVLLVVPMSCSLSPTSKCRPELLKRYRVIFDYIQHDTSAQQFAMKYNGNNDNTIMVSDTVICISKAIMTRDIMRFKYGANEAELSSGKYDSLLKAEYRYSMQWEKDCQGYSCKDLITLNDNDNAALTLYLSVPDDSLLAAQLVISRYSDGGVMLPNNANVSLQYLFCFDKEDKIKAVSVGITRQ